MTRIIKGGAFLAKLNYWQADTPETLVQNVECILATQQGSVPYYREFGVDFTPFLDYPIPEAKLRMIAPIREAIERWEPRAEVLSITFTQDLNCPERLQPIIEVEFKNAG